MYIYFGPEVQISEHFAPSLFHISKRTLAEEGQGTGQTPPYSAMADRAMKLVPGQPRHLLRSSIHPFGPNA